MTLFYIEMVNSRRKMRGADFIKVEIVEDKESRGTFWYSPKDLLSEIDQFGKENFSNLELVEKILQQEKNSIV